VGGGIYEDIPLSTQSGQLVCGSAWVGAQGGRSGASGEFLLWLLGGSYNLRSAGPLTASAGFSGAPIFVA
jgi:hypothetical protein